MSCAPLSARERAREAPMPEVPPYDTFRAQRRALGNMVEAIVKGNGVRSS